MKSAKIYRVLLGDMGNVGFMPCFDDSGKVIGMFLTGQLPDRTNPPAGSYMVDWIASTPKHPNGVFMLRNVSDHTSEEMHSGNWFGDTQKGYKSDTEGCTLVADQIGVMTLQDGSKNQVVVLNSMAGLSRFNELMGKDTFGLEIIDGGSLFGSA